MMGEITIDVLELQKQIYALLESNIKESAKTGLHELLGAMKDCLMDRKEIVLFRHEQSLFNWVGLKVLVSVPPDDRPAKHDVEFHGTVKSVDPEMNHATIIDSENHCFIVEFDLIEKIEESTTAQGDNRNIEKPLKIVIQVRGGVVQAVFSSQSMDLTIFDFDKDFSDFKNPEKAEKQYEKDFLKDTKGLRQIY